MAGKYIDPHENDPTIPVGPPYQARPNQGPPPQDPQGKLVLGSFQNQKQPEPAPRRPYQYPPQQPAGQPPQSPQYPAGQPPRGPQGPYGPPNTPQGAYGPPNMPPQAQPGPYSPPGQPNAAPTAYPNAAPYGQPGQMSRGARPITPRRKRRSGCAIGCAVLLIPIIALVVFASITLPRVLAFGSAISTQAPLSSQTGYMGTSTRTSLLVMGYGGGTHDGAYLTDSMLIVSLLPQSHHTSLISVPRDLWVQNPPNSGNYSKLNAVYEFGSNNGKKPAAGGSAAAQKLSLITGLDVNYWLTIDFTGFKKVIDSIGGVDVNVPDSFNACYPKNDNANVDASWIKADFKKGVQHMDGATAIEYARAREPLEVCGMGTSENLAELTDFGRSARQQIIIKAVLAKVKQTSTWFRLYGAMDALQQTIHTNMSLADLGEFALKMDLNDPKAAHIGLSNQNVLQDSQTNDGQYILQPANGDWNTIPPYVKQHLYT